MSKESEASISVPHLRVLSKEGSYWADGWMTQELHLVCEAVEDLSGVEVSIWNPDSSARYAGNVVTVNCNGRTWNTEPLAMGECANTRIQINVPDGDEIEISISSAVVMKPDALDPRERGAILVSIGAHVAV